MVGKWKWCLYIRVEKLQQCVSPSASSCSGPSLSLRWQGDSLRLYQIYFATNHGSSAQRGPTCPEEPPTVDSREHGWVAAWMCPYPHPAKSAINSNVHKINICPRDYHLDSFNDSFDILIHLFIVHLVLSRVWDAYSHLKQILWDLKPNILKAKKFGDPVTRLTCFWYVWI